MGKAGRIIYWVATVWLALGMTSSAIVQLLALEDEVKMMTHLGYPGYFPRILAVWKILAVIVVLAPRLPLVKGSGHMRASSSRCRVRRSRTSFRVMDLVMYSRRCCS